MRIIDKAALAPFQSWGRCEYCRSWAWREAAHVFARGMDGGKQIDHAWNLVGLCPHCHRKQHGQNKNPSQADLLLVVALREGVSPEEIEQWIYRVRQAPKEGPCPSK